MKCSIDEIKQSFKILPTPYTFEAWQEPNDTWQARWTMPGYLDCGEEHEGDTLAEALAEALVELLETASEGEEIEDWAVDIIDELIRIVNRTEDKKKACQLLERIVWFLPTGQDEEFPPHKLGGESVMFNGDANPIDHGGAWMDKRDWDEHGYADCVRIQQYENIVELSQGVVNRDDETDNATIGEVYNLSPEDEITAEHEIDYALFHSGSESNTEKQFRRIEHSDWFLDSSGEVRSENHLAKIVKSWVKQLTE